MQVAVNRKIRTQDDNFSLKENDEIAVLPPFFRRTIVQLYKEQIGLPQVDEDGQEKLRNSKALGIGVGGLGCAVLTYLSAAGLGKLGLIVGDRVDESNLQRQLLFRGNSVGKFKVTEARKQLFAIYKGMHYN